MKFWGFEIRKISERTDMDPIKDGFSKIKTEINGMKEWINFLYDHSNSAHQKAHLLHELHTGHKEDLKSVTNKTSEWVKYLDSRCDMIESQIESVEKDIRASVKHDLLLHHNTLLNHIKESLHSNHAAVLAMKDNILEEISNQISEPYGEKDEKIDLVSDLQEMSAPSPTVLPLSGPEHQLIQLMFNANTPLTYGDISRKTGKSVNTIRVYMNSAKAKRDFIEEFRKPNGEKIFSIKNKEKVKKLFNLV